MNHHDDVSLSNVPAKAAEPPAQPQRRVRRSREQKAELVARFEASGLKVGEFCRREGLSPPSFYLWRREAAAGPAADPGPGRLLRVEAAAGPTCSVPAVLHATARFANGAEISVAVDHLDALVQAVASC